MACPACQRPIAVARPRCLYCGAALPEDAVASLKAAATVAPAEPATDRVLVILDLTGADPEAVARGLSLPAFEAGQRVHRGGYQLQRISEATAARAWAADLAAAGLVALAIPEAEIRRTTPLVVSGGRRAGSALELRTSEGELTLSGTGLLLVVRGPIRRTYQDVARGSDTVLTAMRDIRGLRRLRTATLEQGYRYHIHRFHDPRPVELDPASFDFGSSGPAGGSTLLTLSTWVDELRQGSALDDDFRRLPPALAPAAEGPGLPLARAGRATGGGRGEAPTILDNVAQFRFYSAWRGVVERRKRASGG